MRTALAILLTLLLTCSTTAQWSTDPNNNLIVGYGLLPELCSDSAGGAYIAYENSTTYPRTIELRRLNRYGYQPWDSARQIRGLLPQSSNARITEDGRNGVLIVFSDVYWFGPEQPVIERLRVQRVDSSGNILWGPNGVRVTLSETNEGNAGIVCAGGGGCVIAWIDTLENLRAQRFDTTGVRVWGDSGIVISSGISPGPYVPLMAKVYPSYFCVGYSSTIFSLTSTVQKIDLDGNLLWASGSTVDFLLMNMEDDYSGGVICSGRIAFGSNASICAQRIGPDGERLWLSPFLTLSDTATLNNAGVPIGVSNDGGAVFCWIKQIRDSTQVVAQRVASQGAILWGAGGARVSRSNFSHLIPRMLSSSGGGNIFMWTDGRSPKGFYAQRLDSTSQPSWDTTDVAISIRSGNEASMQIISDGAGGSIAAWYEEPTFAILAQQVNRYGSLGEIILSVNKPSFRLVPAQAYLDQNYPNPFNNITTIRYEVFQSSFIRLDILNLLGQQIHVVAHKPHQPGVYEIRYDASSLSTGVYLYRMMAENSVQLRKFIVLK